MGAHGDVRVTIRPYRESEDLESVATLFTESVHQIARAYYNPAQVAAWAPLPPDLELWGARLAALETWVALVDDRVAGFISFEPDGHISFLYTSPKNCRQGVASALYRHAEEALADLGVSELFTEASLAARPFFERFGFRVTEEQVVRRLGVALRRFAMRKALGASRGGSTSLPGELG